MGLLVFDVLRSYKYLITRNPQNASFDKLKILMLCFLSRVKSFKSVFDLSLPNEYSIIQKKETNFNNIIKENIVGKRLFSLNQNENFLNWRIYQNPYTQNFVHFSLIEKNQTVANIIFSVNNDVAHIIQFLFIEKLNAGVLEIFLKKVVNALKQENIYLIRNWGFNTNEINSNEVSLLKSIGFTFIQRGITFVWKSFEKENSMQPDAMILSRMAAQGTS